jgi:hypothetical protein
MDRVRASVMKTTMEQSITNYGRPAWTTSNAAQRCLNAANAALLRRNDQRSPARLKIFDASMH